MSAAQKGTEFALCLNSANRDVTAYPATNDFQLDLKDRYDLQMMVLGSFEFPFNQWLIEEAWSRFCFDVGMSLYSGQSRSLIFERAGTSLEVTMLPPPYQSMRRTTLGSSRYETTASSAHGLGLASLSAFPPGSVRLVFPSATSPPDFVFREVVRVVSATEIEIGVAPPLGQAMDAILIVATANTRTFQSPLHLVRCLQAYCSAPFPHLAFLRRMHFEYDPASITLSLEISDARQAPCSDPVAVDPLVVSLSNGTNLLTSLQFNLPGGPTYTLPKYSEVVVFPA